MSDSCDLTNPPPRGNGRAVSGGRIHEVARTAPVQAGETLPVAVLLISFDTTAQTMRCLESLRSQHGAPARICVLDNAPQRGGLRRALEDFAAFEHSELCLYHADSNLGFASGSNALIECCLDESWCEAVILLNNDAVAMPGLVERLFATLRAEPAAGMAGARMHRLSDPERVDTLGIALYASLMPADRHELADPYLGPTGGCAIYSRACLEALREMSGYVFDERFFCYCEDTDLALRANLIGFRPVFVDETLALHEGQASSGGRHSDFITYHGLRNSVWMVAKSMPSGLLAKYGVLLVLAHFLTVVRYVLTARAGVVFRAYRDAFGALPGVLAERRRQRRFRCVAPREIDARIARRFYRRGYFAQMLRRLVWGAGA